MCETGHSGEKLTSGYKMAAGWLADDCPCVCTTRLHIYMLDTLVASTQAHTMSLSLNRSEIIVSLYRPTRVHSHCSSTALSTLSTLTRVEHLGFTENKCPVTWLFLLLVEWIAWIKCGGLQENFNFRTLGSPTLFKGPDRESHVLKS